MSYNTSVPKNQQHHQDEDSSTRTVQESLMSSFRDIIEPRHEISNNVVCATSKASDQPAHMRSLIKAFASRLNIR